ncbi:hypothetical protein ACFVHB_20650 [Kitasatospora sp. NPDC127111]|uniref:hypothetical protein n=1 Tax=Kitasatospora sp. NPDC127111 TaxID=3345363 RepID=UPI00362B2869
MIRKTVRALCAASVALAPLVLCATPAHAVSSCTVNGIPASGPVISGTPGSDFIRCAYVGAGDTVNGLGGNDRIVVTGPMAGTVDGGLGSDYISTDDGVSGTIIGGDGSDFIVVNGTVASTGVVNGAAGNDYLRTGFNNGVVDGGTGFDSCRVSGGNAPIHCEA